MPPKYNLYTYSDIEYPNFECNIIVDEQKIKTDIKTAIF